MVIKRVFSVKDENYNEEFELSGKSGALKDIEKGFIILDLCQMGQYLLETAQDGYAVSESETKALARDWVDSLSDVIYKNIVECAISDVNDDEELELIL